MQDRGRRCITSDNTTWNDVSMLLVESIELMVPRKCEGGTQSMIATEQALRRKNMPCTGGVEKGAVTIGSQPPE